MRTGSIRDQLQLFSPGRTQRWNMTQIRSMVQESWGYARDRYVSRWTVLAVFAAIFPLGLGYLMQVLKGTTPVPKPEKFGALFIDGIKMIPVLTGYAVLLILFFTIPYLSAPFVIFFFFNIFKSPDSPYFHNYVIAAGVFLCLFMLVIPPITFAIFLIIYILTATMGITRFAKTGVMREACNIRKIWENIHLTGWWQLTGAVIILPISILLILTPSGIFSVIFGMMTTYPIICMSITFIAIITICPFIVIMVGRFMSLLYDTGINCVLIPDTQTDIHM